MLHTLFYSDEVRTLDEFRTDTQWVAPQELELAHLLVESLAARFEPAKYKDRYRENLRALLDAKIRGEELKLGAMEPAPAPVPDILEALKASLERLKKPMPVERHPPPSRDKVVFFDNRVYPATDNFGWNGYVTLEFANANLKVRYFDIGSILSGDNQLLIEETWSVDGQGQLSVIIDQKSLVKDFYGPANWRRERVELRAGGVERPTRTWQNHFAFQLRFDPVEHTRRHRLIPICRGRRRFPPARLGLARRRK